MAFWTTERKVGITLSVMFILFVIITFSIKGYKPFGEKYLVVGQFESIGLLTAGAPVRLRGVQIGQVDSINLKEEGKGVLVNMKIDAKQKLLVNTTARILTSGLMGEQYVELEPPQVSRRDMGYIKPGGVIIGEEMYGVDEAKQQIGDVLKNLNDILTQAKDVIGNATIKASFDRTVVNLDKITTSMNSIMGQPEQGKQIVANLVQAVSKANESMDRLLHLQDQLNAIVAENRGDIHETVVSARDAVGTMRTDMGKLADSLGRLSDKLDGVIGRNGGTIDETLDNVRKASESAARSAGRLDRIMQKVEAGQGALGALVSDPEVEHSVRKSLRSAADMVQDASGMMGEAHHVMRKADDTLTTVDTIRSGFGVEYDLSYFGEDDRYGADSNHLRNDFVVTWDYGPHSVRLGANRIGEDAGVEADYGYRWHDLRLLGGVYESDAMLGLEWIPIDRLTLGMRGVGLTDKDHERADFYGLYRVHRHVVLRAGVEGAFDDNYWYGGLGLDF